MVAFDDFDIDTIRVVAENSRGFADQFHQQVDSSAHAGGHEYGGCLSGGEYLFAKVARNSGRGDDERDGAGFADREYGAESIGSGKVDYGIDTRIE
jgi:hypothetical protein